MADSEDRQQDARAMLAEALWNDPETRPDMERLIKRKWPKAAIPTHDVRQEASAVRAELDKVKTEIKQELEQDRSRRELEAERRKVVDAGLATADEIPAIEKLMKDELIGTHLNAARLYRAQQQVAAPRTTSGSPMELPISGDEYKGIVEDRDGWARKKAYEVLASFQKGA